MYRFLTVLITAVFLSGQAYGQTIVAAEYFFDSDPGPGSGTAILPFTAGTIQDIMESIPSETIANLSDGNHKLFVRIQDAEGDWSTAHYRPIIKEDIALDGTMAPPIVAAEYFFDSDTGPGSGTAVQPFTAGTIQDIMESIPSETIANLSDGIHKLFIRFQDVEGDWSTAYFRPIIKEDIALDGTMAPPIVAGEYFFDSDTGPGSGTAILPFTAGTIQDIMESIPPATIAALSDGIHKLFVRFQDVEGDWSTAYFRPFLKETLTWAINPLVERMDFQWYQNNNPVSEVYSASPPFPVNPLPLLILALLDGLQDGQAYELAVYPVDTDGDYGVAVTATVLISLADPLPVYEKLLSFTDLRQGPPSISLPYSGLTLGIDGNFYGATDLGGAFGLGTIYRMAPDGTLNVLVEFNGSGGIIKGKSPRGELLQAIDLSFYGTTQSGGSGDYGTVFRMTTGGELTTLVEFTGNNGSKPESGLVQGSDGRFYGTTSLGGATNDGTVYRMSADGTMLSLIQFSGDNGRKPFAALIQGSDELFYGTTAFGGASNQGVVFSTTPSGGLIKLAEFNGTNGREPYGELVQNSAGDFWGTTRAGGANSLGTLFKLTPEGVLTKEVDFTGNSGISKGSHPMTGLFNVPGNANSFYGTTTQGGVFDHGTVFNWNATTDLMTTLVEFTGTAGTNKGSQSHGPLTQGVNNNLYGTTLRGGESNVGTVFKVTLNGDLTTLVEFEEDSIIVIGEDPSAALVEGSDDNYYGTTVMGGTSNLGTIFRMTPGGDIEILYEFTGAGDMGSNPHAALVQGNDGKFYGTTRTGGLNNFGTVFRITTLGVLEILIEFTGNGPSDKGRYPEAAMTLGNDGNFYGTTTRGGALDFGTVFKWDATTGLLETLIEFSGNGANDKGRAPKAALILGTDGNFYGTTTQGGALNHGTLFKYDPLTDLLMTLIEFTGNGVSDKGSYPAAALLEGSDGNFYGTTQLGGSFDLGTVFKWDPVTVTLTTLLHFSGLNGSLPQASLVEDSAGFFYGTTSSGGSTGNGTVFRMSSNGINATIFEFVADSNDSAPKAPLIIGSDSNLYGTTGGSNGGAGGIFRIIFPGAPTVDLLEPETLGVDSAVVSARINARGSGTDIWVDFDADGAPFDNSLQIGFGFDGFQTMLFGTTLNGLISGTTYYYRFRATNDDGETLSVVNNFTTLALPIVSVTPATSIQRESATFNGLVDARTYDTTVLFEYGDGVTFPFSTFATNPIGGIVTGSGNVPVSLDVAGLSPGINYTYRIVAENIAGSIVSGVSSFTTLTDPEATIGGVSNVTSNSATVEGIVNAKGSATTVLFEYADNNSFMDSTRTEALESPVNGNEITFVSLNLSGLPQGAEIYYRILATSAGSAVIDEVVVPAISETASFDLDILSGFEQEFPTDPEPASGQISVQLSPSGIGEGWRFVGEQIWRQPGVAIGLTTGDREIEFRPVPGYQQPLRELISIISGEAATFITREYFELIGGGSGMLTVTIKPESIALESVDESERAQWRLLGEDDTKWRNSGFTQSNLFPGNYLVESKDVDGRVAPSPISALVSNGENELITATYRLADSEDGIKPSVLSFDTVTTSTDRPFAWVGQIQSDIGSSSGFVVKERVVATAAHVVFDDGTLEFVSGLSWRFQRDRGNFEPLPLIPRGFYIFDDYSVERDPATATGVVPVPGEGTTASQNLDAAALFFLEDAGRGGYGGFLASDSLDNEFLLSDELKVLVGFPVDTINAARQGRMHATPPMNVAFEKIPYSGPVGEIGEFSRIYRTIDITSFGGNSGGPVFVEWEDDGDPLTPKRFFPAAIYLGGSSQTVVRSIDSPVIDLFNRAEVSGNGGDNGTGGGISAVNAESSSESIDIGFLKVNTNLEGAGWQIMEADPAVFFRNRGTTVAITTTQTFTIIFETVPGFGQPPNTQVILQNGVTTTVTGDYLQTFTIWRDTFLDGLPAEAITPIADPDGDKIKNLHEFAFNLLPNVSDTRQVEPGSGARGLPNFDIQGVGINRRLCIEYVRRKEAFLPVGFEYNAEFTSDPGNEVWEPGIAPPFSVISIDEIWERIIVQDPVMGNASRVGRVRVVDVSE